MRAVNLIPPDQRRAGAGGPGRSGAGVYVLLGALGVLAAAVAVMVFTSNSISSRQAELAKVTQEVASVEAQANALKPYRDFATLREKRLATVAGLATSRFDWERTMSQLARVLPPSVSLTSLTGSVAPGTAVAGAGGATLRSAINAPAVDLVGCASNQAEVSRVMSRLRRMTNVTKVALSVSEKSEQSGAAAAGAPAAGAAAGESDCRTGSEERPQFTITVFFKPLAGAAAAAPGAAPVPAAAPAGAGAAAQPASTPPAPATP
jgi:Tfp pilus assembly protein PilN